MEICECEHCTNVQKYTYKSALQLTSADDSRPANRAFERPMIVYTYVKR